MGAYSNLSVLYDELMQDAPYTKWLLFLQERFPSMDQFKIADIGCGTGILSVELAKNAQSVVGIDISADMLAVAFNRTQQLGISNIQFFNQDVKNISLHNKVDLVVSTVDCLNYMVTPPEFRQALSAIRGCLKPGGWFAFDMLGQGRLNQLGTSGMWYDINDEKAVIYDTEIMDNGLIDYEVTMFTALENGLYQRFEEHHQQRAYTKDEIEQSLQDCGFKVEICVGDFGQSPIPEADRIVFIAKMTAD